MKDAIYLLFHLLTTIAKLLRPGGCRSAPNNDPLLLFMANSYFFNKFRYMVRPEKPPINPSHSTNPTQAIYPNPIYNIIRVDLVGVVGFVG